MRRVAIIPARAGSKRVPRKNLIEIEGRAMIEWTFQAARESGAFDAIYVSSDSSEIENLAKEAKVGFLRRPDALAGDDARVGDVCLDSLEGLAAQGEEFDVMAVLYATAPLRNADDVIRTVSLVEPGVCDFAVAVTRYSHPVHQALVYDENGSADVRPAFPEWIRKRGSELPSFVVDNGSTYAVSIPAWRKQMTWFGSPLCVYEMPRTRSVDLDEPEDLSLLQFYASQVLGPRRA